MRLSFCQHGIRGSVPKMSNVVAAAAWLSPLQKHTSLRSDFFIVNSSVGDSKVDGVSTVRITGSLKPTIGHQSRKMSNMPPSTED